MKFKVITKDLFTVDNNEYTYAHCISSDCCLGGGIAKIFKDKFQMKHKLLCYRDGLNRPYLYEAIYIDNTFNLITKKNVYNLPTINAIRIALKDMKRQCIEKNITKIAMPKIGCGIDQQNWQEVENVIRKVFDDTDIEILVCEL